MSYEKCFEDLKKNVNWDTHCISVCNFAQDREMNTPSNRFDKSHLLCYQLQNLSTNVRYVDKEGWDFENPYCFEDKTEIRMFVNQGKIKKEKRTIQVMLKNTRDSKHIDKQSFINDLPFVLLLLRQTHPEIGYQWVAALDPKKLDLTEIHQTKDQVQLKFDSSKLDWIYKPDQNKVEYLKTVYNTLKIEHYSSRKKLFMEMCIKQEHDQIEKAFSQAGA